MLEEAAYARRATETRRQHRVGVAATGPAGRAATGAAGIAGFRTSFNEQRAKYSRSPAKKSLFFLQISRTGRVSG